MNIGFLSDAKLSLPLMKLSAWHKQQGHKVKLVDSAATESFDILYVSKVFNLPFIYPLACLPSADEIIRGGSGYAITVEKQKEVYNTAQDNALPDEIEHTYPDYELYGESTAHGFLTRGCKNNCGFCIVSKKEGCKAHKVADLKEFWSGQSSIKLYDANLLDCDRREELLCQLVDSKAKIDYTQGLDARLMDKDVAALLCRTKIDTIHFAFDNVRQAEQITKGISIFTAEYIKQVSQDNLARNMRIYILTNYNSSPAEDLYRANEVRRLGLTPYVMIYRKGTHSQFLTDLQRWSNNMRIQRSVNFEDYIPRVSSGRKAGELYPDVIKEAKTYET